MRRSALLVGALAALAFACGPGGNREHGDLAPAPREAVTPQVLDARWEQAVAAFRNGKWNDATKLFQHVQRELPPGDPRVAKAHFFLGNALLARSENLDAVREFRRVSDESPNDPLAPDALLRVGDAYADLWKGPELDPTYGQTALAAYQELVSRYPGTPAATRADERIKDLQEMFAVKEYKAALYYLRYKAYDSAILYLKDLVATYPRAAVAPEALIRLVGAYRKLGYQEDIKETCGYIRRFHPDAPGIREACPGDSTASS
ncbi:MAG TPA: outer membrane protein assembly factor BamD [Gemmatimonadales bacterium]|nr:outer membrane protein assembly factor BamD [Gemmatimonadales bacterium]